MDTNQIYEIVNDVAQQTMGESALAATDTASLVAMGNAILSSSTNTEAFIDTLVQRIGRTIISYRPYKSQLGLMAVSDMTMGAIMQKIKVKMPSAVEDVTTQLIDGQSIDQYIVSKPRATQKLFVKRTPYTFYVTIQKKWLREAFTSEVAMGSFISAIYGEIENALELSQENLARLCMANFMASISESQNRVINLVTEYNALVLTAEQVTADNAMINEAFLRYALGRMNNISKKMKTMSTLYNDGSETRHSPEGDQRFVSLVDFQTALETQVQWAAFHDQYVKKQNGIEVPYWQSAQSPLDINLIIEGDDAEQEESTTLSNIVAFIHDRDALGTYRKEVEVATTPLNARGLYTNQFWHMNDLYFNDVSENGVIFTLN
jgi:hypothetical protein